MNTQKLSLHDFEAVGKTDLLTTKGGNSDRRRRPLPSSSDPRVGGGCSGAVGYMAGPGNQYPFGQGIADGIAQDWIEAGNAMSDGLEKGWNQAVDIATDFYNIGSGMLFNTISPAKVLPNSIPTSLPGSNVVPPNTTACN